MATYAGAWYLRRGLFMPWELDQSLDRELVREGLSRSIRSPWSAPRSIRCRKGSFARVATMEAALYMRNQLLRDTDWASMAHSLEVRTPLVDAVLLRESRRAGPAGYFRAAEAANWRGAVPATAERDHRQEEDRLRRSRCTLDAGPQRQAGRSPYGYAREWARYVASREPASDSGGMIGRCKTAGDGLRVLMLATDAHGSFWRHRAIQSGRHRGDERLRSYRGGHGAAANRAGS